MLTQAEADALIEIPKRLEDRGTIRFPLPGDKASWAAVSLDSRERFLMDVSRGRLNLIKCTYQNRYRITEILVRVDIGGPPHRNPDGEVVNCPHLHLYREGFGDKWATALPADRFGDPTDLARMLRDFLIFCNVEDIGIIEAALQ